MYLGLDTFIRQSKIENVSILSTSFGVVETSFSIKFFMEDQKNKTKGAKKLLYLKKYEKLEFFSRIGKLRAR